MPSIPTKILIGRLIGILGMSCLIAGNFFPPTALRASLFITGCILLLLPPIIEYNIFFICLQIVALSGASLYFVPIPLLLKAIIPIIVVLLFCIYFHRLGRLNDKLTLFGIVGVSILALGYGITRAEIYFFGGLVLAIYSWLSYRRGVTIAIMWAITNVVFCFAALYAIFHSWG